MRRPSPATVIASTALFFSLAGTSFAVGHYVISSTKQIKPSVLQSLHGKTGAQGPAGPAGAQGPQGPQGPTGTASLGSIVEVKGTRASVPAKAVADSIATCPAGDHVVSGGDSMYAGEVDSFDSEAERPSSWFVVVTNGSTYSGGWVEAIAYCAPAGQAVAARVQKSHPAEAAAIRAQAAALARGHLTSHR